VNPIFSKVTIFVAMMEIDSTIVEPVPVLGDAKSFAHIHPSRGLNITGRVFDAGLPSITGPLPLEAGRNVRCLTLLSNALLLDVFLYDEFVEKCQNVMVGDDIHIRGSGSIVHEADPSRSLDDNQYGRSFLPYCIAIAYRNCQKLMSFRVSVLSAEVESLVILIIKMLYVVTVGD
jgi:hypothetical protein